MYIFFNRFLFLTKLNSLKSEQQLGPNPDSCKRQNVRFTKLQYKDKYFYII